MTTKDRVRAFIIDEVNWDQRAEQLEDDFPLLESRVLDSMGIFKVVSFVESEFGVEIKDDELVPEHFNTIGDIARLVDEKRG